MSRDAIEDLIHTYADAVVRRDVDQWASTWAEDAKWELGRGRAMEGREAIVAFWNKAMDGFNAVVQNVVNGTCDLDHDAGTGTGRWYIIEHWHRMPGAAAEGANVAGDRGMLLAYYDDNYVRTDAGWLFASRELTPQYSGPPDLSGTFLNAWGGN